MLYTDNTAVVCRVWEERKVENEKWEKGDKTRGLVCEKDKKNCLKVVALPREIQNVQYATYIERKRRGGGKWSGKTMG